MDPFALRARIQIKFARVALQPNVDRVSQNLEIMWKKLPAPRIPPIGFTIRPR